MAAESVMSAGRRVRPRALRLDVWWLEPALIASGLLVFVVYSTWAALQNANYYAAPYLSPFYSPCLVEGCAHLSLPFLALPAISLPILGLLSPAFFILWIPGGFRLTCYYYRKAYYRSFFWSPPACAVPDARRRYTGEARFPFILQNVHRYFFWLSIPVLVFLWIDVIQAFQFPNGFGIGVGTLVLLVNTTLLSLYTLSCHSCRHIAGGGTNEFSRYPGRFRVWQWVTALNKHHMLIAWCSLIGVGLADLYVRLVATGAIVDLRIVA